MCVLLCLLRHQYITIAGLGGNGYYCLVLDVFRVLIKCKELATATQLMCPSCILLNAGVTASRVYIAAVTSAAQAVCMHIRLTVESVLTLRLLMSYIYGAPSKARNANVVYVWTYVWQR